MSLKFKWETEFKETEIGEIPKDWKVKSIGQITKEAIVGSTPLRRIKEYWEKGTIPWLTNKEVQYNQINFIEDTEEKITPYALKRTNLKLIPPFSLIVSFTASVGKVAINKIPITTNQQFISFVLDSKENVKFYAYYLLLSQELIESFSGATPFSFITKEKALQIPIPYPSPPEQSRIATVLSWFDDLIENKKRQNEILEKVAMAIFKSWFVDFEPFKDEEFVYNEELGKEIPKGWEVKPIGEVVDILYGKGLPESKRKNGSFPVVGSSGIVGYHAQFLATPPSIAIGRKGNVGSVYLMLEPFYPIDTVFYTGKTTPAKTFYIYHHLKLTPLAEIGMSDTAVPGININNLKAVKIPIPPQLILQRFHTLVEPLFQKIILNQRQIMVLRKIRDALLPKLVFGKLRVEEI